MRQKNLPLIVLLALLGIALPSSAQQYTLQQGDKVITDDGNFIVSGQNLITNPGFDDGFAGWKAGDGTDLSAENFEIQPTGGPDGSPCLHALKAAGSGSAQSIKTGWAIEEGKTYVFQCFAYRTSAGMANNTQYSRIYQANSENGTDTQVGSINYVGNQWAKTTIVFTADKPYLVANLGWLNSASSFDCFFLAEVTVSSELITDRIQATISEAQELLASTEEGNAKGQYTTEVRTALQAAIYAASGILSSPTSQAQINEAINTLRNAITAYKNAVNPPFVIGKRYLITNMAAGINLTTGDGTVCIKDINPSDPTQVFIFEKAPADAVKNGYNIKDGNGTYIYRSGSWDTKSGSTDLTAANAIFNAIDYGEYIQLRNEGSGSVLGIDNTTSNSVVYSNKNGTSSKNCWTLTEVSDKPELYTKNLETSIAQATNLLTTTEEGNAKGQYKKEVRDALQAAIDAANSVLASATEQTQVNDANTALQEGISIYQNSKNPPFVEGIGYTITNIGANKNLATLDGGVKIKNINASDSTQVFYFVKNNGGYNIHDANKTYIFKDSGSNWEMKSGTDIDLTSKDALFIIEDYDSYVLIKNANRSYIGTDVTDDDASVYDDKAGSADTHRWKLIKHTPTAALEELIIEAEKLLNETEVGTEYYQVPQTAADALSTAINTAKQVAETTSSYDEANQAHDMLKTAMGTFNDAFNPLGNFADGQTYLIRHYGGNLLTNVENNGIYNSESNNARITAMAEDGATEDQLVTFEAANSTSDDNEYYIRSVSSSNYLACVGEWNTEWRTSNTSDSTIFHIEKLAGKYLGLKFVVSSFYLGTDDGKTDTKVYSNKGTAENSYWTIEPYVTIQLNRTEWKEALAIAENLIANSVIGYKEGMYFKEDLDAFKAAVTTNRSAANKARTQEELDAITIALKQDIESYKAKAHTEELINREDIKTEITKATNTYEVSVAGELNGQYPEAARTALKAAIDAAQAVVDNTAATQDEIDAQLSALKQSETDFAQACVVIDYDNLRNIVNDAQKTITDATPFKGEGAGKYPQSAFDALQVLIDQALDAIKNNSLNQKTVAELTDAIAEEIVIFKNSRISNDYSELQPLVDEATRLISQAEAGQLAYDPDYLADLKASLEKNSAALESNDQTVIDRAAKMLKRDIEIFHLMVTGIDHISIDNLRVQGVTMQFFDLNGRQVIRPDHGIYVVRITTDGKTITRKVSVK